MGLTRFDTLTDFARAGCNVVAQCEGCGHKAYLSPSALMLLCAAKRCKMDVVSIGPRLRCQRCGRKGARIDAGWSR